MKEADTISHREERVDTAKAVRKDDDFYAWLLDQSASLRSRRSNFVEWDAVAEELEAMAAKERRDLVGQLRTVLTHLLKWQYSAARRSESSWRDSIVRARQDAMEILDDSRTLKNELPTHLNKAYRQARSLAGSQMRFNKRDWQELFPETCPWDAEREVLNEDFFPTISERADRRTR
jgi:Domain of unknown function DUF29